MLSSSEGLAQIKMIAFFLFCLKEVFNVTKHIGEILVSNLEWTPGFLEGGHAVTPKLGIKTWKFPFRITRRMNLHLCILE